MDSSNFPTRLADLSLSDATIQSSLYAHLKSIRKATLSIHNRMESILDDAKFVQRASKHYGFPLVANERCGSWYIDPHSKIGSAYFKSTDGHHGQWDFSLRRLNLQLLPMLAEYRGVVIVDSTRRGKNLPDAFSKTVPIWVAVINRALFPESTSMHKLQTPPEPDDLGVSEISQIEARIPEFTKKFFDLRVEVQSLRGQLRRPIVIRWAINGRFGGTGDFLSEGESEEAMRVDPETACHELILCSASHRVQGAEVSEGGYIQGAGDDSEAWSHGLTAQLFWTHKELLLRTDEDELPRTIRDLLQQDDAGRPSSTQATRILPTSNLYIADVPLFELGGYDLIVNCQSDETSPGPQIVNLQCRSNKLGSKDLRDKLPIAVAAVRQRLSILPESRILVTCSTGKDLSVGVVVAILCLLSNDKGELQGSLGPRCLTDGDSRTIGTDGGKARDRQATRQAETCMDILLETRREPIKGNASSCQFVPHAATGMRVWLFLAVGIIKPDKEFCGRLGCSDPSRRGCMASSSLPQKVAHTTRHHKLTRLTTLSV
jgi:tRNA A64-2'-O-ribosylphosphate transferase